MSGRVAVIDIGSNSIKSLVAERSFADGGLKILHQGYREVRISSGISGVPPMLKESSMEAGKAAVAELWEEFRAWRPISACRIVATSAVRSASNGSGFAARVASATGQVLQILSGEEEADGIARGVMTDPALAGRAEAINVFDLGGGSMELIRFEQGRVVARCSLPLGSVRLTEKFVPDPALPIPAASRAALQAHIRDQLAGCGVPLGANLVGCGGGINALFAMLRGDAKGPVTLEDLECCMEEMATANLAQRIAAGVPAGRADIFPTALITVSALVRAAGAHHVLRSRHNLRYGIASSLLGLP